MTKFGDDYKLLLDYVGGKDNIKAVSHCVTRMRFVLIDSKKANIEKIESLKSVKGTFTQSGQFQVIIGNDVDDFYKEFTKFSGLEGVTKDSVKESAKTNQNPLQRAAGALGEIFAPIIPALVCGGIILGFRNIIGEIPMFDGKTLAATSQFWEGTYNFLWLLGEAIFHLLPVPIVWSITKKMGTTQVFGIILGLTLVSGQLLNGFAVANTPVAELPVWDFGFTTIPMIGYQGQVISAILAGFVLVYLEKFFKKITPEVISMIVVPFFSLLLSVVIAHTIVGPIGWKIGNGIADVVYKGLTSNYGVIFAAIFGLLYAPVVMTGLHHMTNAIDTTLTSTFGGTILWPMIALSNIAQGSSVLGMMFLQRKNKDSKQINIPAMISAYLGVTEPALFGVNLKYGFPLVCGMIGSSIAAIISVGFGVQAFSIGVGGLPGIISIMPKFYLPFLAAMGAAIIIPFILTIAVGKKKLTAKDLGIGETNTDKLEKDENMNNIDGNKNENLISPMTGYVYDIADIKDKAFSSKSLGDGIAIEITDGEIISPVNGKIELAFPTKHAYGIKTDSGKEILIHIGMDTVELNGEGFNSFVKTGDIVKQGDLIAKVDLDFIKSKGKSLISPIIFTDGTKIISKNTNRNVKAGEKDIIEY